VADWSPEAAMAALAAKRAKGKKPRKSFAVDRRPSMNKAPGIAQLPQDYSRKRLTTPPQYQA
jgi:hypothetical protein